MSDAPQPFVDKAFWWLAALVVGLFGTIYGILNRDIARVEQRVDRLQENLDKHLEMADEGFQRLASIEALVTTLSEDRKEAAVRIEAALVRIHERLDKVLEDR